MKVGQGNEGDLLPTAVRVWTEGGDKRRRSRGRKVFLPQFALVFDTETTTDRHQQLNFGSYRYYRLTTRSGAVHLECAEEGLFYADDLKEHDPAACEELHTYVAGHSADVIQGVPARLRLMSRREFVNTVFFQEAYKKRSLIVGFNLPFDLSRLANHIGAGRGRNLGGFSLQLWDYESSGGRRENRYRPRIAIKAIDSKRAMIRFTRPLAADAIDLIPEGESSEAEAYTFPGHFLDLRTLVFALTDRSHSLKSACEAFGVTRGKTTAERHGEVSSEYIEYNRRDVEATAELLQRSLEEYQRHPIDLAVTKAYSPASIGKGYMHAMGIRPRLELQPDFPREVLGYAMSAYYGGRAECRIRHVPVPVVYLDFLSMYPTVNALMGLWTFHVAERVSVVEVTDRVREQVESISLEECFRKETWRSLPVLVQVAPEGDVLPIRAKYQEGGPSFQVGVNPLSSGPRWYALADVFASVLLSGKRSKILRALRLVPSGLQSGLRTIRLRGQVEVDPTKDDLLRITIEERHRLRRRHDLPEAEATSLDSFLKVLANSTSYGMTVELNPKALPNGETELVRVFGIGDPFDTQVKAPENPGQFSFPPLASCITAGARLMLAMVEASVAAKGGSYAACDTDSMMVVSSPQGGSLDLVGASPGTVRALSWTEVDGIRARFGRLSPYDSSAVAPDDLLKLEDENFETADRSVRSMLYALAISAKRYALFDFSPEGNPRLRKASEHGLGHLRNPMEPNKSNSAWIEDVWSQMVDRALRRHRIGLTSQPSRNLA